jgi:Piwi domain
MPSRVVVYRNGSSEGNFDLVLNSEVAALRKAFYDLRKSRKAEACKNERNCQGNGCAFCTPIITYIVALSQHNVRIVPAEEKTKGRTVLNVPSGTCLDHTVTPYLDGLNRSAPRPDKPLHDGPEPKLFSNPNSLGFDFLLTAHGGLKGTSKPIFYRVVSHHLFCLDTYH